MRRHLIWVFLFCVGHSGAQTAQFLSWPDAKKYVSDLSPEVVPAELRSATAARDWNTWVRDHDSRVRARLAQGEDDTIYNLLIFGTSFTSQPRITSQYMSEVESQSHGDSGSAAQRVYSAFAQRVDDLVAALTGPARTERFDFIRAVLSRRGINAGDAASKDALRNYLYGNSARVRREYAQFEQELRSARASGDPSDEIAARAVLFRNRGIALDTSILPDYALERALSDLKQRGLLNRMSRVAIVGPGLDFIDKSDGYDFFPQQTTQPFAVLDSLYRMQLAGPKIELITLDISDRVNSHIKQAKGRAFDGKPYPINLVRDPDAGWHNDVVAYWDRVGEQIGTPSAAVHLPGQFARLKTRAFSVRPEHVKRLAPYDLNIVYQHLLLRPNERFDLVIATNILVYYDVFEQELALANLEHMISPGGFLLTNNALLELPHSPFKGVDYTAVPYSDKAADGDQIFWYQLKKTKTEAAPRTAAAQSR